MRAKESKRDQDSRRLTGDSARKPSVQGEMSSAVVNLADDGLDEALDEAIEEAPVLE